MHIIIADDHFLFRTGLEVILKKINVHDRFTQCENGLEVLAQLKDPLPQLIFMDIRMPKMDGIEATINIRRIYRDTIKIIALTMMDDKASIIKMIQAGANGYVIKNTDTKELKLAMTTVLEGGLYISEKIPQSVLSAIEDKTHPLNQSNKFSFSSRELDVLKLVCQGYSNLEASYILSVSVKNIEAYKTRLMAKTQSTNSSGLVRFAFENGLIAQMQ